MSNKPVRSIAERNQILNEKLDEQEKFLERIEPEAFELNERILSDFEKKYGRPFNG